MSGTADPGETRAIEEISIAGDVRSLLDSRGWQMARAAILGGIEAQMDTVPMKDTEMHSRLILTRQCFRAIEKFLENAALTGQMAQMELQAKREQQKKYWERFTAPFRS
jgi:hypothetical protein